MNDKSGSNEWARLPLRCLKDSDLTLSDVIVLAVIIDYIDYESKAMSIEKIMQKSNLSRRQVIDSIKILVKAEYLTAESAAGKKTVFTQRDVLPPKRQQKKKKQTGKCDSTFDLSEYMDFINDIPELTPEQNERIEAAERRKSQ